MENGFNYIKIEPSSSHILNQYSFNIEPVSVPSQTIIDVELNNTVNDAQSLPLDNYISGLIMDHDDVDWFAFQVDSNTVVDIYQLKPTATHKRALLSFYDTEMNLIAETAGKYSLPLLQAGTYYLKVSSYGEGFDGNSKYKVKIKKTTYVPNFDSEREPNDSKTLANLIDIGTTVVGSTHKYNSSDWFSFYSDSEQYVTIWLNENIIWVDQIDWYDTNTEPSGGSCAAVYLYDENNNFMGRFSESDLSSTVLLPQSGTYYLKVDCHNALDYQIVIEAFMI